jgi:transposase
LSWEDVKGMDDKQLRRMVRSAAEDPEPSKPLPDYAWVHQELKKKSVTMGLLWQEYKAAHPDGYQETQFREYYYKFAKSLQVSMRQRHKAGESMFVDYAGQTVPIYDRATGKVSQAQIFVATLGASNYSFAEATPDQSLASWIGSHVRAFEYFGGVSGKVVPDNLKCGVTSACRYEPDINPTYADMIAHYGTVVIPARVRRPKDKAKVENAVLVVERWILATLRNRKFFSIAELNQTIKELLVILNQRRFKKLDGSRESVFLALEKPALKPLPERPYEFAGWKKARVNMDYHIEIEGHYYSTPYTLAHEEVDVRHTTRTVEIFHNGRRVGSHAKDSRRGHHSTVREHMPKSHQQYLEWTPTRIIERARVIGPKTTELVEYVLGNREFPQQGYRTCLGIIRLAKEYSGERLEAACRRALAIHACSYRSVHSILERGLDRHPLDQPSETVAVAHENIRGGEYFINWLGDCHDENSGVSDAGRN